MTTRAVVDTNVVISSFRASSPSSPARDVFARWVAGEFRLLYQEDILEEYAEVLARHGVSAKRIAVFISRIYYLGEEVDIEFVHMESHLYPKDPDDIPFLLCALNGGALYLVSYDEHLLALKDYHPVTICEPIAFLEALRA